MSKTADSSLVCAGPLVSVATTGTNCFVCRFDSCEASIGVFRSAGRPAHIRCGAISYLVDSKGFFAVLSSCRSVIQRQLSRLTRNPTARGNTRRYYFNRESMKISEEENIAHGKDILPFQLDFSHMRFERRGEMCVFASNYQ